MDEIHAISCYIFKEPLSPDIASWIANSDIDFNMIIQFCERWIKKVQDTKGRLLIETAGGVCSPCSDFKTMADISHALPETENILVAAPYLGAISHTVSALHVLKFKALIINQGDEMFIRSIRNHLPYNPEIYVA